MAMTSSTLSQHNISLLRAQYCENFARLAISKDPEAALDWIAQGIAYLQSDNGADALHQQGALNVVASTVWGQLLGNFEQARAYAERGLELLPSAASVSQLTGLINLGVISIQLGAIVQGKYYLQQGITAAEQLLHQDKLAALHINMGIAERRLGNWEKSLEHQGKACHIYQWIGNNDRAGSTYINMGMVYLMRGDTSQARVVLDRAMDLAAIHNLAELDAFAKTTLADLELRNNKPELATELLENARTNALQLFGTAYLLTSIRRLQAMAALKCEDYDTALAMVEEAIGAAQSGGYKQEEGIALSVKGAILDAKKEFGSAALAHQKSLEYLDDQDPYELARAILAYGQHCLLQTNVAKEMVYASLHRARLIFTQLGSNHELQMLEHLLL